MRNEVRSCYTETRASFAAGRRILRVWIDIDRADLAVPADPRRRPGAGSEAVG